MTIRRRQGVTPTHTQRQTLETNTNARTNANTNVGRTGATRSVTNNSSSASGFDRVRSSTTTRNPTTGADQSSVGFNLLSRVRSLSKKAVIMSSIGFALLLPPTVGQMMHPGMPKAESPLTMQMQQMSEQPSTQQLQNEMSRATAKIPSDIGEAREDAVLDVIGVSNKAGKVLSEASSTLQSATSKLSAYAENVGTDAKMGYAVDLYWFGVPDDHATFHAGSNSVDAMEGQTDAFQTTAGSLKQQARGEVRNLLVDESPAFAELHGDWKTENVRLKMANKLLGSAHDASDAIKSAQHAITMRNITPRTVEESYQEQQSNGKDANGNTQYTSVTKYRTVDNPAWDTWNLLAVSSKSRAERAVRDLNDNAAEARGVLGETGINVDEHFIDMLDFFGHPSFAVWSFDSADLASARSEADQAIGALTPMRDDIQKVFKDLDQQVQSQTNARWSSLESGTDAMI